MTKTIAMTLFLIPLSAFAQFGFTKNLFGSGNAIKINLGTLCSQNGSVTTLKVKIKEKNDKPVVDFDKDDLVKSEENESCWAEANQQFIQKYEQLVNEKCQSNTKNFICRANMTDVSDSFNTRVSNLEAPKRPSSASIEVKQPISGTSLFWIPTKAEEMEAGRLIEEALSKNPINCDDLINGGIGSHNLLHFHSVIKEKMNSFKKLQGTSCGNTFPDIYAGLAGHLLPKNYPGLAEACQKNSQRSDCVKWNETKAIAIENLKNFTAIQLQISQEDLDPSNKICNPPFPDFVGDILNLAKKFKEAYDCTPLKINEERLIDANQSAVSANYLLKRVGINKFEATIPIKFTNTQDGVTPSMMMARVQDCTEKMKPYLNNGKGQSFDFKIIDENQLQELPQNLRPTLKKLGIRQKGLLNEVGHTQSSTAEFESHIDCTTMTHELLHMVGLCDEYDLTAYAPGLCVNRFVPLTVMGGNGSIGDNVIPSTLSCDCSEGVCSKVMNGSDKEFKDFFVQETYNQALNSTFINANCTTKYVNQSFQDFKTTFQAENPGKPLSKLVHKSLGDSELIVSRYSISSANMPVVTSNIISCRCNENDSDCKSDLANYKRIFERGTGRSIGCPGGSKMLGQEKFSTKAPGVILKDNTLQISYGPLSSSLIAPAQFERIVNGNCPTKAEKYSVCAKWKLVEGSETYDPYILKDSENTKGQCKTNGVPNGNMNCAIVKCSNRPKFCTDGSYME